MLIQNPKSKIQNPLTPTIQRRALGGILSLAARDVAVKLLAFAGWIVLARLLDPPTFGLFAVANFALSVFALFSQLGLGASVVRAPGEIEQRHLDALFTLQAVVVTVFALLMLASAPVVGGVLRDAGAGWLVAALAVALALTSLRSVPVAMQERKLAYSAPVMADLVSQLTYWLVAIAAAWAGWGVWSVVASVTVSSMLGTVALFLRTGWRPRLNFDWQGLRGDALFGLMFGSQALSHFTKYAMLPLLGGVAFGGAAVGYLTWAHQLATLPVQLSQLVSRVAYPALSHLQGEREAFARLAASNLKWTLRLTMPAFAVIMGLAPQVTEYVYGAKWLPALNTLLLLCASMALSMIVGVLIPALYSTGRGRAGMLISLGWTGLTWLVGLLLVFGGVGFEALAIAYVVASVAALVVIIYVLRGLGLGRLLEATWLPLVSALPVALGLYLIGPALVHNLASLVAVAAVGGAVALAVNLVGEGRTFFGERASPGS